jgi:signal transduction histidine kinase
MRLPRQTVRLRLTLLYVGLFLVSAAGLLVLTYSLVALESQPGSSSTLIIANQATTCPYLTGAVPPSPALIQECIQQEAALRDDTLHKLLAESGVALAIMAVASVGLGWLMAGRVLSPLRVITATARRISARNLHERLAMTGPDDELKELGDTFDQLLSRLDDSFRAQRQFVANASHELRTPLARQRTLLEVALRDPGATNDQLRAACERAIAAGEQHERLISAMLTLAQSERGLDRWEPFDLAEIVSDVLAAQDDTGLTLTARLAPAPTLGNPRLAERLVTNLIDNAIRYNVRDGRLEVRTGTRDGRPYLAVTNTGLVIPPQELGRLFQPFARLDATRASGDGSGFGLGLAIVGAIAAAHGAELRAHPEPAGGLAVEIEFQRASEPPAPALTARSGREAQEKALPES